MGLVGVERSHTNVEFSARSDASAYPATTYDGKKNHRRACNMGRRVYNTHMKNEDMIDLGWFVYRSLIVISVSMIGLIILGY